MSHLEHYLAFYKRLQKPGFAVLVTGAWGTGKTFQVRRCVSNDKYHYVSLFGVQTVDQLHAEVLAAAYPNLHKSARVLEKLGNVGKEVDRKLAIAGAVPSVINALLRRSLKPDAPLIFDDLERSNLRLKDLLGAINFYVEQRGFAVVVITHEEKLQKRFRRMKEKTFGHTMQVEPQVEEAFENFVGRTGGAGQEFIRFHQELILRVFAQSDERSLRVLRQVIDDLDRLHGALSSHHLGHNEAMRNLVELFTAFDIETRAGRLSAADLRNRLGSQNRDDLWEEVIDESAKNSPFSKARKRYPSLNLADQSLNDDLLVAMFVNGRYDDAEIRKSLDNSPYFLKPADEPPWKTVIQFDKLEDDVVEQAWQRMETQFTKRSVSDSGEMLHIFALRLMMAENGISNHSFEEEIGACKAYIDDLLAADSLPPSGTDYNWHEAFDQAHDGYGYWVSDRAAQYFSEIKQHLIASRKEALRNTFPQVTADLLAKMTTDAKAVFEMISPTNNGDNPYAFVPLLHNITPEVFVETWLSAPKSQWRTINYALRGRYEHDRLEQYLGEERDWALEVRQILLDRAATEVGFAALRIRRVIPPELHELAKCAKGAEETVPEGGITR